jgi:uncharacterized membrane protein YphA (DoxX/SURF4 family)
MSITLTEPTRPGADGAVEPRYRTVLTRYSVPLLRIALGVVFVWFGALKVAGVSPVGDLVAGTVPFLDPGVVVPALGAFEVVLGLMLMSGRLVGWVCVAMVAHLAGTFLVYVAQPGVAFQNGNPVADDDRRRVRSEECRADRRRTRRRRVVPPRTRRRMTPLVPLARYVAFVHQLIVPTSSM